MVAHRSTLAVQRVDGLTETRERVVVVEGALDEADPLRELLPRLLAELCAGVVPHSIADDLREVLIVPLATGEADEGESGGKEAAVGEVVHGRHQLLA